MLNPRGEWMGAGQVRRNGGRGGKMAQRHTGEVELQDLLTGQIPVIREG